MRILKWRKAGLDAFEDGRLVFGKFVLVLRILRAFDDVLMLGELLVVFEIGKVASLHFSQMFIVSLVQVHPLTLGLAKHLLQHLPLVEATVRHDLRRLSGGLRPRAPFIETWLLHDGAFALAARIDHDSDVIAVELGGLRIVPILDLL